MPTVLLLASTPELTKPLHRKLGFHYTVIEVAATKEALQTIPNVIMNMVDLVVFEMGRVTTAEEEARVVELASIFRDKNMRRIALYTPAFSEQREIELVRRMLGFPDGYLVYDMVRSNRHLDSIVDEIVTNFDKYGFDSA